MMIFFNKRKTLRRCQLPVYQQPDGIAEVQLQTVSVVDHEDNILSRWCEATGRGVPRGEKVGARFALDRQQNLTNSRRCLTLAEDVPQRGLRHSVAAHHTEGCLFQKRQAYVAGNCQREKGCLSLSWNWNKCPLSALRFTQERHWDLLSTHVEKKGEHRDGRMFVPSSHSSQSQGDNKNTAVFDSQNTGMFAR